MIKLLIKHLQVAVTNTSVREALQIHPDYPSLLSLSDTLDTWHIQNAALKLQPEQFKELEAPFVAQLYQVLYYYFVFVGIWQKGFTSWNEYGFISAKL